MSLTSIQDRYRAALLAQPAVSTITLVDGSSVRVEDVYLPRTLLHEVKQEESERESGEPELTVKLPVDVWAKLDRERVVVVEGPAGIGKSTLTKQLVRESRAHYPIPIWIAFRPFVASGLSLADYLDHYYVPWLGLAGVRVPYRSDGTGPDRSLGQWLFEQWKDGFGGLLIVDGLDEVFQYDKRVTALQGLPITRPGATRPATLLTSRPLSQSLSVQMAKVEVQGLTPPEQLQFVEQYRASLRLTEDQVIHFTNATKKQAHGRLRELLTRPGHLIQILTTYARTNTLLDTETAVLDELLTSRLTIIGRTEPPVEGDDSEKKRLVLASLALHLLACRQGQRHTRAQLLALIRQVLEEHKQKEPLFPFSQATALLNDLTRNSALLTEVEPDVYEFETVVWLEHLTGSALADQNTIASLKLTHTQALDFLDKKAWDPEWEPVLMSWVGMAQNPFPLFNRLTDKTQDDLARHRLGTAGRCLSEVISKFRNHLAYQVLSMEIPMEAFERQRAEVERMTIALVRSSLRGACVDTAELVQQALVAQLEDPDANVRCHTSVALIRLGPAMSELVQQALVARLEDPDQEVRRSTGEALGDLGPAMSEPVQQALVAWLEHPDADVRWRTSRALTGLGPAMSELVQQALVVRLEDPDADVRGAASLALDGLGPAMSEPVQQALVVRLEDPDADVRGAASEALGGLGPAMSEPVQQALMARLEDPDKQVRSAAGRALGGLGPAMSEPVQQALVAWLEHPDKEVRAVASGALGSLGPAMSEPVQQALVARLEDPAALVRRRTSGALIGLGPAMSELVQQALVAWLEHPHEDVRASTSEALGGLGPAMSEPVQQALMARLEDPDAVVQGFASGALGGWGPAMPELVQQALVARLEDPAAYVRSAASEALGKLGPAMSEPVQQALVARLEDPAADVRWRTSEALGGLGPAMSEPVQQTLVAWLEHPDAQVRASTSEALGGLGPAMSEPVQQALVARLEDPAAYVRSAASLAISSAQEQGLRLFQDGAAMPASGLVSNLSVAAPLADRCSQILNRPTSFLAAV